MSITNRIKEVMRSQNMTIKAFAELIEVPYRTIQNYLLNKREPSVEVLTRISEVLNVDLNWLIRGNGKMFNSLPNCEMPELSEQELNLLKNYRMLSGDTQTAFSVAFDLLSKKSHL